MQKKTKQNISHMQTKLLISYSVHVYVPKIDPSSFVAKYYSSFNNILNVLGQIKTQNEMVAVHFIKSYCLRSMAHSCETWTISHLDIRTLDTAWNNAFRKTFNSFQRESETVILLLVSLLVSSYFHSVAYAKTSFFGGNCFTVTTILLLNVLVRKMLLLLKDMHIKYHHLSDAFQSFWASHLLFHFLPCHALVPSAVMRLVSSVCPSDCL